MKKIIIFTNNERSINIIKRLKKKYKINLIVLSKKFLTKNLISKIKRFNKKIIYFEKSKKLFTKLATEKPDFILCCVLCSTCIIKRNISIVCVDLLDI